MRFARYALHSLHARTGRPRAIHYMIRADHCPHKSGNHLAQSAGICGRCLPRVPLARRERPRAAGRWLVLGALIPAPRLKTRLHRLELLHLAQGSGGRLGAPALVGGRARVSFCSPRTRRRLRASQAPCAGRRVHIATALCSVCGFWSTCRAPPAARGAPGAWWRADAAATRGSHLSAGLPLPGGSSNGCAVRRASVASVAVLPAPHVRGWLLCGGRSLTTRDWRFVALCS